MLCEGKPIYTLIQVLANTLSIRSVKFVLFFFKRSNKKKINVVTCLNLSVKVALDIRLTSKSI